MNPTTTPEFVTLPLSDIRALVALGWELTRHIEETDRSATGSICGIEYADKTIARVAAQLEGPAVCERWSELERELQAHRIILQQISCFADANLQPTPEARMARKFLDEKPQREEVSQ